jgi:hypothetical protein
MKLNIFIGFDSTNIGQELAFDICKRSILKNVKTPDDINIHCLIKHDLEKKGYFNRDDNTGSTEFTYTRFLAPFLCNYKGYAVFCDSDFLWNCDITDLLQYINKNLAISCVQHEYKECNHKFKMNGIKQEWYPRKNWTSLIVFNCEHPDVKKLNIENINSQSPQWLHRMHWTEDLNIGNIPHTYNYLVNYYDDINHPNAIHYTDGGPWHFKYINTEFSQEWLNYLTPDEHTKLNKYLLISSRKYLIESVNKENYKKTLRKFDNFLKDKKNICIVGKGSTSSKIVYNEKKYDLYVGIKHAIYILPRKDIHVLNDFEGVFGLENTFKDIKWMLFPNKPHKHCAFNNKNYVEIVNYITKYGFKGDIMIYELHTNKNPENYLEKITSISSSDIIINFLNKYDELKIDYYGVAIGASENIVIRNLITNATVWDKYNSDYTSYNQRMTIKIRNKMWSAAHLNKVKNIIIKKSKNNFIKFH